jgi:hypothetical protein
MHHRRSGPPTAPRIEMARHQRGRDSGQQQGTPGRTLRGTGKCLPTTSSSISSPPPPGGWRRSIPRPAAATPIIGRSVSIPSPASSSSTARASSSARTNWTGTAPISAPITWSPTPSRRLPADFTCHVVETEFWGQMPTPNLMVESSIDGRRRPHRRLLVPRRRSAAATPTTSARRPGCRTTSVAAANWSGARVAPLRTTCSPRSTGSGAGRPDSSLKFYDGGRNLSATDNPAALFA